MDESRATAEADLVCEREDAIKLRNAKAALEKEIKSERKKRKQAEEDKANVEEELRRLKGAANREVEKRREQEKSSVEIEELNKQLGQLKLKIANKKEKLKAARKEIAILNQREKERLVDEDASYYATPDFNKLGMDELLRLEEHYLSSLRVVGVAKVCAPPRTRTVALHRYSILYLLTRLLLFAAKTTSTPSGRAAESQGHAGGAEDLFHLRRSGDKVHRLFVFRFLPLSYLMGAVSDLRSFTDHRVVLIPCGHRCLCRECSTVLNKCPICRKAVSDRIDTY